MRTISPQNFLAKFHPNSNLTEPSTGGKKGGGRGKGGSGSGRGVRGVDFGLGIGYKAESSSTPSQSIPNRTAAVNSLKTGMMAQFKSNFIAASSNSQSESRNLVNSRSVLSGFVSGGSIGGESYKAQPTTHAKPAGGNGNQKLESSRERPRERKRPSGWDR